MKFSSIYFVFKMNASRGYGLGFFNYYFLVGFFFVCVCFFKLAHFASVKHTMNLLTEISELWGWKSWYAATRSRKSEAQQDILPLYFNGMMQ